MMNMHAIVHFHQNIRTYVPEPEVRVISRATWLVPKAHANDVSGISEKSSHLAQALDPDEGIKLRVAEKGVEVVIAATPAWLCQVVV